MEPEEIDKDFVIKLAIKGETQQLQEILLQHRELWTIKDWTGDSLLAIACWQNKYETAKMLVELGFDLDSVNQNGSTPLHRACYRNNIELVILLTNHGANHHLRDKSGRKPADVGDRIVRKVLLELDRISEEEKERETFAQMEMEQEREMALAQVREEQRHELVHKRQQGAVPIVVQGAKFHRVNGCYEPVDEIHQDWPVYSLRGDRDIWMLYVGDEWLIQSTKDKGTPKAYVRLKCEEPTYPELRMEGNKGVIESTFSMVFGVPFQFSSQFDSKISIMTEEEAAGIRATEMFKLAERRSSEPPLPHHYPSDHTTNTSIDTTNTAHSTTTRSQSDEIISGSGSGMSSLSRPLRYEEEELMLHHEQTSLNNRQQQQQSQQQSQQQQQQQPHQEHSGKVPAASEAEGLLTHCDEEDDQNNHDHEL